MNPLREFFCRIAFAWVCRYGKLIEDKVDWGGIHHRSWYWRRWVAGQTQVVNVITPPGGRTWRWSSTMLKELGCPKDCGYDLWAAIIQVTMEESGKAVFKPCFCSRGRLIAHPNGRWG